MINQHKINKCMVKINKIEFIVVRYLLHIIISRSMDELFNICNNNVFYFSQKGTSLNHIDIAEMVSILDNKTNKCIF